MKILIPIDFSKRFKVAVNYAARMATELEAELVLLNVLFLNAPPLASMNFKSIEDVLKGRAEIDCVQLINELKEQIAAMLVKINCLEFLKNK